MKKFALFLSIFLDIVGFSIAFPLGPAVQDYYIVKRHYFFPEFGHLLTWLEGLTSVGGALGSGFYVSVLFGGLMSSVYSLLQFLFSPFWGRLSDRFGRRALLMFSALGMSGSYLIWCVASTFELFLLSRIVGGIMAGSLAVATASVADLSSHQDKQRRAQNMAIMGMAFGCGFLFGPALGGLTAQVDLSLVFSWLTPFSLPALLAAGLSFINFLCLAFFFQETLAQEHRRHNPMTLGNFGLKAENGFVKKIALANFAFIFAFSGIESTLSFLGCERLGFTPKNMGLLFMAVGLTSLITQGLFVRRLAARLSTATLCMLGFCLCTLAFIGMAQAYTTRGFVLANLLSAIGTGITFPMIASLVAEHSSAHRHGENMGVFRSMGALGRAFGPLLGAYLYFSKGGHFLYWTESLLCLVPLLIIHWVKKEKLQIISKKT